MFCMDISTSYKHMHRDQQSNSMGKINSIYSLENILVEHMLNISMKKCIRYKVTGKGYKTYFMDKFLKDNVLNNRF